jgi:16S rRNA (cytosine1402-N4)-methyltransferase
MSSDPDANIHRSVLLDEMMEWLVPERGGVYVDATLGMGGHAEELLRRAPIARLIGMDQDLEALEIANRRLSEFEGRFSSVQANFEELTEVLETRGISSVDGIMADLGVSSLQFDSETRGFSFRFDAPLDMRMNPKGTDPTGAELLLELPEEEIANLIYRYGEERHSRKIARRIVERRNAGRPVATTAELAKVVEKAVRRGRHDKIHPATRTFQALRIAVNRELDVLENFIPVAIDRLAPGGRLVVITFHSIEDRIVKQAFQKFSGKCSCPPRIPQCVCGAEKVAEVLTRKPVTPKELEIEGNPRARSAKLRAVRKLER